MSKLLSRPSQTLLPDAKARYENLGFTDNPFPAQPAVDKDSQDPRINGDIYEIEIRRKELQKINNNFLKVPQSNPNHLRLGYIIDTSYIGRGNGKSAFLINLHEQIGKDYCFDISSHANKCFSLYIAPEPGGRCKTFPLLMDLIFSTMISSEILDVCLATIRLEALNKVNSAKFQEIIQRDDADIIKFLNNPKWYEENAIQMSDIVAAAYTIPNLSELGENFPLFLGKNTLSPELSTVDDFKEYYKTFIKKPSDKLDFIFSKLVYFFESAGFNGAYILIDNFERIPDFQSGRQKKDFASELRTCFFDGFYRNAKIGFYNVFLVLHAGVPGLISEAWSESGLDNRAPINPKTESNHIVLFEKLSKEHAILLIRKYLDEYRIKKSVVNKLLPFTEEAISYISQLSEYNASKILKFAYELIEKLVESSDSEIIDKAFVEKQEFHHTTDSDRGVPTIDEVQSEDLLKKVQG